MLSFNGLRLLFGRTPGNGRDYIMPFQGANQASGIKTKKRIVFKRGDEIRNRRGECFTSSRFLQPGNRYA